MNLRFLLATFALASACGLACSSSNSSGGGTGGGGGTCLIGSLSAGPACDSCMKSKCDAELSDAFGSGYASGNLAGGKCPTYGACVGKCPCGDTGCLIGCGAPDATCTTATDAINTCEHQSCASACTSTGTGGSGGSGGSGGNGTVAVACSAPAKNFCIIQTTLASDASMAQQACTNDGGTVVDACPTANLDGCCKLGALESCGYNGAGTQQVQQDCATSGGTWVATP